MKSIGNIYLAWRKDEQSSRILVGVIKQNANDGVRFFYLADGAIEARRQGFEAYPCFPDVTEVYTENILSFFGMRIFEAAKAYENSEAYFDAWDIKREYKSKPLYMLAYTQGMLPSDHFEFLASFNPCKGFSLVTELCDLQSQTIVRGHIAEGDELSYKYTKGKAGVKLYKDRKYIGQVKVVHDRIFQKAQRLNVRVYRLESTAKVFIRIAL